MSAIEAKLRRLPPKLLFVDMETTGLFSSDRVVSLGLVQLQTASIADGAFDLKLGHWVFDPQRKSHHRAEEVHGYNDWVLRHQDPFEQHAGDLAPLFDESGSIVAHNASFDQRFIDTEFALAGLARQPRPYFCTMQHFRRSVGGRSGLNAVLHQMGLARSGKTHGAFEDAWMAMQVYLWLHGLPQPPQSAMPAMQPSNLRPVPPLPDGPLPRRRRKSPIVPTVEAVQIVESPIAQTGSTSNPTVSPEARARLLAAARPTAVLMMWISRSDGIVDSEIAAVAEMVGALMTRLKIVGDTTFRNDIAAALSEIEPSPHMIDQAAKQIVRDADTLAELGKWLKLVTYADGKGTDAERDAVARLTQAFVQARLPSEEQPVVR